MKKKKKHSAFKQISLTSCPFLWLIQCILIPKVQNRAAALIFIAIAFLIDLGRRFGRVALHHSVEILQTLELVVPQLLPINPKERTQTFKKQNY